MLAIVLGHHKYEREMKMIVDMRDVKDGVWQRKSRDK